MTVVSLDSYCEVGNRHNGFFSGLISGLSSWMDGITAWLHEGLCVGSICRLYRGLSSRDGLLFDCIDGINVG